MNIQKIIYELGIKQRNPSLVDSLEKLNESDFWPKAKIDSYQFEKCKELLIFAYRYSEFYTKEFDKIGFNPSEMKDLSALKKLLIIDKTTLINHNKEIHSVFDFNKKFFSETSGTTGQVLKFYRNEEWDSGHRAAIYRGYSWYGIEPWDRNGYFWGYNIGGLSKYKVRFWDVLQNRFRIFSYDEKSIVKFVKKLAKAKYLHGYSSMIYEVAKKVNLFGLSGKYQLSMIKGTSEKIYDSYQSEVFNAFGLKIISEYGSSESGIIAYECPEGHNMHIVSENVIVEEINGEIVVTNLLSKSFPIIRYRLGDSITLAKADYKCKCGRNHPVILDIEGRVGKNIEGKEAVYPSLTFYYVFKNLALNKDVVLNYQAIQTVKGKVTINIEQNKPEKMSDVLSELYKYFKNDIDFELSFGVELHSFNGKLKDFISYINQDRK